VEAGEDGTAAINITDEFISLKAIALSDVPW
jgi:hypothetical protein